MLSPRPGARHVRVHVCVCVCDWVWYCDRVQRQLFCWQLELIVLAPLFYSPPQQHNRQMRESQVLLQLHPEQIPRVLT